MVGEKEYEYECCIRPGGQIFAITHLPEYYMDEFVLLVGKYVYRMFVMFADGRGHRCGGVGAL